MPDSVQQPDAWPDDEIPPELLAGIGWVIVAYSHLEEATIHICYDIAGVNDVVGRIALRAPRLSDRVKMVRELADQKRISLGAKMLRDFEHDASLLSSYRDYLAHGVYYRTSEGTTHCRRTRGNWTPDGSSVSVSAVTKPPAFLLTVDELAGITARIRGLIDIARAIRKDVRAQLALQHG